MNAKRINILCLCLERKKLGCNDINREIINYVTVPKLPYLDDIAECIDCRIDYHDDEYADFLYVFNGPMQLCFCKQCGNYLLRNNSNPLDKVYRTIDCNC